MSLDYVWEKFYIAVDALAIYEAPVQARLYNGHISALIRLEIEDVPTDMLEEFVEIKTGLERSVPTSRNPLSDAEAKEMASRILEFYTKIVRRHAIDQFEQIKAKT